MAPKFKDGDVVVAVSLQASRTTGTFSELQQFSGKWVAWAHTAVAYGELRVKCSSCND